MKTVPIGLQGWNKLTVSSCVTACDPGCNSNSYYSGSAYCSELLIGQELTRSLVDDNWWQSSINPRFSSLILLDVKPEGALLKYAGREIFVQVEHSVKLDNVPLDYAYAELYVRVQKTGEDVINSIYDVFTREQYEEIVKKADEGDRDAINHLAYLLFYGVPRLDIAQDMKRSHLLWKKAAELGQTEAIFAYGQDLYWDGGTIEEKKQALELYKKAADANNHKAIERLADMLYTGDEGLVEVDVDKAFEYYQKAYELGNMCAATSLGMCYYCGSGVKEDEKKAFTFFNERAFCSNSWASGWACYYLGRMYRLGVTQGEGEDRPIDKSRAFMYYRHAVECDIAAAMTEAGYMLFQGDGVRMDMDEAVQLWLKAAEKGEALAAYYLAMYYEDKETGNDPEKADYYQQLAADLGDEDAQREIELGLRVGEEPEKEIEEDMSSEPKEDYAALLVLTEDNPLEHARVIWRGFKANDYECTRRLRYVAFRANETKDVQTLTEILLNNGDSNDPLINDPLLDAVTTYDPLYKYNGMHSCMTNAMVRLYVDDIAFNDEKDEIEPISEAPKEDTVKWWYSWYQRNDCASMQRRIYDSALPYAYGGNGDAQYIVGNLLYYGAKEQYSTPAAVYIESDTKEARSWLEKAAENNIGKACAMMMDSFNEESERFTYYMHKGAELNEPRCLEAMHKMSARQGHEKEAFEQLKRLADTDDLSAMLQLAEYYRTGYGVKKDENEAFRLVMYVWNHSSITPYNDVYERAGNLLQRYYKEGVGTPIDPVKAMDICEIMDREEKRLDNLLSR